MEQARVVIVGGGVVGCALAAELAAHTSDVFVLEQMPRVGMMTSTRNSGVIHSGIYYTPGSLKARHCVEGNRLTYEFCATHDVPHRRTGKVVVATTPEEEQQLHELLSRGRENSVEGLEMISAAGLKEHEPHIAGHTALWVPSAGKVESERLVKAFAALAEARGTYIATEAKLQSLDPRTDSVRAVAGNAGEIETRVLVNAAGLFADEVAAMVGNNSYKIYPCRGEYWEVAPAKAHLVNGLVYPAPDPSGLSLGVHLTKTLWGTLLLGPNARYVERKDDYEHDLESRESFCARAQKLLPQLQPEDLRAGYSGLRAKLAPPGHEGIVDFVVAPDPRFPQVIHLVGIESPGLTAAASLARTVAALVLERLN
ncbi:MAG TPA: NAD(P)/FAD-dependent oxidoreductase [Candidatus Acidoferrales bacterium]|nr:NAD(P)/FAD-dependent oxidoreductase [Candidatus Acidoferrales bacterium]